MTGLQRLMSKQETMTPQYRKPLPYTSFGGTDPRWDNPYFWNEVSRWTIGLRFYPNYAVEIEGGSRFRWGLPGLVQDIKAFIHRGRYGWASSDTWSLDHYLNQVLAGSLEHLAYHSHGVPAGFPEGAEPMDEQHSDVDRRFALWQAKLLEWAKAFHEDLDSVNIYDRPDYTKHRAEEERRTTALHKALKEIEPWWSALWD